MKWIWKKHENFIQHYLLFLVWLKYKSHSANMKAAKLKSKTCKHSERFKKGKNHNHTNNSLYDPNMCKAWSAGFPNVPWLGWWSWLIEPHNYKWVVSHLAKHLILAVFVTFSAKFYYYCGENRSSEARTGILTKTIHSEMFNCKKDLCLLQIA